MNEMSYLASTVQLLAVMVGAPLVIGVTRQVRALFEGRAGGGVLQPWRDLRKQLGKQQIRPLGTTVVFAAAPAVVGGTTLLVAVIALVAHGVPAGFERRPVRRRRSAVSRYCRVDAGRH